MEFVMIKDYENIMSKEKIILGSIVEEWSNWHIKHTITLSYFLKINGFDENDEYKIIHDTDSIQIRPKAIYKNDKGYYKKLDNKRIYFNEDEVKEIEEAIAKYKNYLGEKGE